MSGEMKWARIFAFVSRGRIVGGFNKFESKEEMVKDRVKWGKFRYNTLAQRIFKINGRSDLELKEMAGILARKCRKRKIKSKFNESKKEKRRSH